jgi:hypothetical protein
MSDRPFIKSMEMIHSKPEGDTIFDDAEVVTEEDYAWTADLVQWFVGVDSSYLRYYDQDLTETMRLLPSIRKVLRFMLGPVGLAGLDVLVCRTKLVEGGDSEADEFISSMVDRHREDFFLYAPVKMEGGWKVRYAIRGEEIA